MEAKRKKYEKENKRLRILTVVALMLMIVLIGLLTTLFISVMMNNAEHIERLELSLSEYEGRYRELVGANMTLDVVEDQINQLNEEIKTKQTELTNLEEQIKIRQEVFNEVSYKAEITTKYDYALYDTEGKRNDLNFELLELGHNLMTEYGLDPNLLFGIIMVESEGHAGVTNSSSGAAGLGQFMPETGEYVSTKFLNTSYDHSVTPYDPASNIRMMASYLDYLYKKYNGNTMRVLKEYCGGDDSFTQQYYQRACNAVGYCIE